MKKKYFVITLIIVVLSLAAIAIGLNMTPEAPAAQMEQAARALSEAKKARADIYSEKQYNQSKDMYDSALQLWKAENEKFILNRNFTAVDSCIKQSISLAKSATNNAMVNSKNTEASVLASIKEMKIRVKKFEKLISDLPLNKKTRQNFENGRLLLSEANYDYEQKNYLVSKEKLTRADKHLKEAISDVKVLLQSYFKSYSTWKKWHSETLTNSRKSGQNAIVVDKMAKTCYVYKAGNLKHTFEIELGKNWIGNKRHQGDKTTPEGIYKVTKKLDSKKTIYHRALLINYPNEDDKKRFTSEKKNGALPRNANIGGLIEIHGDGGKGVNWTDGCVALHNKDMEVVYKLANVNTTVTIVGSLVDLSEIIDF